MTLRAPTIPWLLLRRALAVKIWLKLPGYGGGSTVGTMADKTFTVEKNPHPTSPEAIAKVLANPGFGANFTDHMVIIDWYGEQGWHDPRVVPYGPITLDPATTLFHYGQEIFEGLKAYRQPDGSIATFRPDQNCRRMQNSAKRLAMPRLPEELFMESLHQLVEIDADWVPEAGSEAALYLRPFMIATEKGLGVHPSSTYRFYLIASPAGSYFSGGIKPVTVWLCEDYVRACPGGTGAAKFAGNYAASLAAQSQAEEKGCDQVVWLDAIERNYVEEMGGMNLAFIYGTGDDAKLVTPALSGSLLPGVTRDSLLKLAEDRGMAVEERKISTAEWREAAKSGEMSEAFACGTAAVITPVGTVKSNEGEFTINGGQAGPISMELRETLTGIQHGSVDDSHGWRYTLVK